MTRDSLLKPGSVTELSAEQLLEVAPSQGCSIEDVATRRWRALLLGLGLVLLRCDDPETGVRRDAGEMGEEDAGEVGDKDAGEAGGKDAGEAFTPLCVPRSPRFAGELCGTRERPCELLEEWQIAGPEYRNDAPAIAVDLSDRPSVAYMTGTRVNAPGVYEARTSSRAWERRTLSAPFGGGHVFFTDRGAAVLAYADDYRINLITETESTFFISGWIEGIAFSRGMAGDLDCLHVLRYEGGAGPLAHALRTADGWSHTALTREDVSASYGALALSKSGMPHMLLYEADSAARRWNLIWRTGGAEVETIPIAPTNTIFDSPTLLAVTGEMPHVLRSDFGSNELRYEVRRETGWSSFLVAADTLEGCDPNRLPADGERCTFVRTRHRPVAIAWSDNGSVRLLYGRRTDMGTMVGECFTGRPGCIWMESSTSSSEIRLALIEGDQVRTSHLAESLVVWSGSVAVDSEGRLHLVTYEHDPGGFDKHVRYRRFGPL